MLTLKELTLKRSAMNTLVCTMLTVMFGVTCFLFWYAHPHLMSYQEQYQLFLYTSDYFVERVGVIGGFADYVGEFVVQFYYVPWMGALAIALTLTLLQCLTAAVCIRCSRSRWLNIMYYALSTLPSILIWHDMGDENMLMSYPVALILMQLWLIATLCISEQQPVVMALDLIVGFASLYWLAGPVAFVYLVLAILLRIHLHRRWLWLPCALMAAFGVVWVLWRAVFAQYPLQRLLMGINYYRIPEIYPIGIMVVAATVVAVSVLPTVKWRSTTEKNSHASFAMGAVMTAVVAVFGVKYIDAGFDENKEELMLYDYLVRNQQWQAIIHMAENRAPSFEFGQQAVNLALAKTGLLNERMFEFAPKGIGSLIAKYERNNTTCLVSAETFYHLGMINSAFRYNFDLQEAIMNDRKSGRFLKRMAECQIINGNYKVAEKYINKLKHSLFYGNWAKRAETYLYDEQKIAQMPEWARMRQVRFKQEMLYDYPEIEKVLGLLALESEGANLMAWDYFNAVLMLKNDLYTLTGMYHYANELFGLSTIPRHLQEAIAMYWTMGHPDFTGLPYPLSDGIKQQVAALAQTVMQHPNQPATWVAQYPGSYCVYLLQYQMRNDQTQPTAAPQKGSERGD